MSSPCQNVTEVLCDDVWSNPAQPSLELWAWLLIGFGVFAALAICAGLSVYLARRQCTNVRRRKLHAESAVSSLAGDHLQRPQQQQQQQQPPRLSSSSSPGPLANSGASFDSFSNNWDTAADQDWFLHSLESAVFAPSPASSSAAALAMSGQPAVTTAASDCRLCVLNPAELPYGR